MSALVGGRSTRFSALSETTQKRSVPVAAGIASSSRILVSSPVLQNEKQRNIIVNSLTRRAEDDVTGSMEELPGAAAGGLNCMKLEG